MFRYLRWLVFSGLVLSGYIIFKNGWWDVVSDRALVDSYLHSRGTQGLLTIIFSGALFTALGAPRQLLALGFGFALGGTQGTLLSTLAATMGAAGGFFTARWLMRKPLERRFGQRMTKLDALFKKQTLLKVLMVRLLPVGSNLATNLLAGCSGTRFLPFLIGSAIGYLPQMLVFSLAGAGISTADEYQLVLSVVLFTLASMIGGLLYYHHRTKPLADSAY